MCVFVSVHAKVSGFQRNTIGFDLRSHLKTGSVAGERCRRGTGCHRKTTLMEEELGGTQYLVHVTALKLQVPTGPSNLKRFYFFLYFVFCCV